MPQQMSDLQGGQALLMEGWAKKADAVNCLNLYFSNITDPEKLRQSITDTYKTQVTASNMEAFLQVIQSEFKRNKDQQELLREMAFEIVASKSGQNPSIVAELKHFSPGNQEL